MNWSTERKITLGFCAALLALAVVRLMAYTNANRQTQSERQVAHTQEVLSALGTLLSTVQDAEAGQHAYIMTGDDERYLAAYHRAIGVVGEQTAALRLLTAHEPSQRAEVERLEPLLGEKFASLDEAIRLRQHEGFDAAARAILTEQGETAMSSIRAVIGRIQAGERRELQTQAELTATGITRRFVLFYGITTLELSLLVLGGWLIRRYMMQRDRNADALRGAQERLSNELRAKLAAVVNAAASGILMVDERGTIEFANPAALSLFGYAREELVGRNVSLLMPEPYRSGHDDYVRQYVLTGQARVIGGGREIVASRKDGTTFPIDLAISEVPPEALAGRRLFTGIVRDITGRKRAEAEILRLNQDLRRRVTELEALFAVMPIGIALTEDVLCREVQTNPIFQKMLRIESAQAGAAAMASRFMRGGRAVPEADLPLQLAARTGVAVHNAELEIVQPDGGAVTSVLSNAAPLFDEAGRPRGAVLVVWDVTALKRAEEMRAARDAAEAANRAKDDFIAALSHDLRTPIGAILLILEVMRRDRPNDRQMQCIQDVERSAQVLSRLIEDILDVARITHGKLKVDLAPLELGVVAAAAVDAVRPLAQERQIEIEITPAVGSGSPRPRVLADAVRLQQVFWNLLTNAIKFSPRGSRVRVEVGHDPSQAWASVIDAGKGIAAEFLPHVFDRLAQPDGASTHRRSGLGLGLFIVRNLVELHGGTVDAHSDGAGRGATFTVRLPLHRRSGLASPDEDSSSGDDDDDGVAQMQHALKGMRVLLVHHDDEARDSLGLLLGLCGAQQRSAASVAEARTIIQEWRPDALIGAAGIPGADVVCLPALADPQELIRAVAAAVHRSRHGITFDQPVAKSPHPDVAQSVADRAIEG